MGDEFDREAYEAEIAALRAELASRKEAEAARKRAWRSSNRDRYNAYMREYRRRRKARTDLTGGEDGESTAEGGDGGFEAGG